MPTYEYSCQKCGKTFELFQSMKDDPLKTCPESHCQSEKGWESGEIKRLLGAGAGLIFKGSGFYITDYRSSSYKESAKKEQSSTSSTGSSEKSSSSTPSTSGGSGSGTTSSPKTT
ncbi:MAG: FmdB family zinc ribbon protein [Verrucomicrobiales bacterium]